jgi:hypothetical protein
MQVFRRGWKSAITHAVSFNLLYSPGRKTNSLFSRDEVSLIVGDITTVIMSDPCNIELRNYRYVQTTEWKGEPRIDVREWGTRGENRIPTRKGISLKLQRWRLLVEAFDSLDKALEEKTNYSSHIGGNVFVSVRTDSVCVDIRQYWIPPNQTDLVPVLLCYQSN